MNVFINKELELDDLNKSQLDVREKLNEKIRTNNILFEDVPCLCGSNDSDLICSIDRNGLYQKTVICRDCGLIRSNPRMTEEEYRNFYESDTYGFLYESENIEEYFRKKFDEPDKYNNDGKNILERVKKFKQVDESVNILEFGCGAGYNLMPFLKEGANCTGIDYSKIGGEIGREYGLNILQGGLEKVEGRYDIIMMCHVLEHFLDPIATLKQFKSHLTSDGLLYISVPNMEIFGLGQIQNAHTYYFVPDNFKYFTECAGLKNIDLGESQIMHMYGIFKVENITPDLNDLLLSKEKMFRVLKHTRRKEIVKWLLNLLGLSFVISFIKRFKRKIM